MFVMNYQMSLPSEYDVDSLRTGIPRAGKRFDDVPGLGIKAWLLRQKGVDGSPLNQYAPFYLWSDLSAAATFLWDNDEFSGLVDWLGRPVVQTWVGGGYHRGPAFGETVTHAVRTVTRLAPDIAPAETATELRAAVGQRLDEPGLHSIAWAIDPRTWESLTFVMHSRRPDPRGGELYEVPYVSMSAPDEVALHEKAQ
jgi:hypothetical protein